MTRSFAITTATSTLRLEGSGQGQVSFTVSNALGRPVRAWAHVEPEGQTRKEWLSLADEAGRDFDSDGTHHFTVKLSLPPGTPEGRYAFHLVVVNVDNPDEEFAVGPTVALEAPRPPAPSRRRLPRWALALAAVGVVLLIALVALVAGPRGREEEPGVGGAGLVSPAESARLGFDGTGDYVDLGNPRALDFSGTVTVEAWVRPRATNGLRNILAHGFTRNPNAEFFLRINNGRYEVGSWDGRNYVTGAPIPPEDLDEWVHLAGVYDGTRWRLYRNGEEEASTAAPRGIFPVGAPWAIGARGGGTERFFQGELREVRLWSVARGEEELREAMRQPLNGDEPGLVGFWSLDEGRGALALDRTAQESHGVLRGADWVSP